MDKEFATTDAWQREAQRLANGKAGHSPKSRPGYLRHSSGRWRDPVLHARIVGAYTRAWEIEPRNDFALYSRALEQMNVGDYAAAERDLEVLTASNSSYAIGTLPVNLYLLMGDRERALVHLEALNVRNRSRGSPLQTLQDFESWL